MALDIPEYIRRKVLAGLLPPAPQAPIRVWAGTGNGQLCNGCDRTISAAEFECELESPAGQPVRLHKACFDAWKLVRV
jgi:hypothetical protein